MCIIFTRIGSKSSQNRPKTFPIKSADFSHYSQGTGCVLPAPASPACTETSRRWSIRVLSVASHSPPSAEFRWSLSSPLQQFNPRTPTRATHHPLLEPRQPCRPLIVATRRVRLCLGSFSWLVDADSAAGSCCLDRRWRWWPQRMYWCDAWNINVDCPRNSFICWNDSFWFWLNQMLSVIGSMDFFLEGIFDVREWSLQQNT